LGFLVVTDPFANFVAPLWAIAAYIVVAIWAWKAPSKLM
jgi:hypothetical protein